MCVDRDLCICLQRDCLVMDIPLIYTTFTKLQAKSGALSLMPPPISQSQKLETCPTSIPKYNLV
jgi:hypothetical protein